MYAPAQSSRQPIVTYALIAINVALYLLQVVKGANGISPSPSALIGWGANVASYTLVDQPWRLFTSMFLHIGLLHLAMNMYMLYAFGAMVERRFGQVQFLLMYILAGLVGSLVSAVWHLDATRQVVAAGASGALMGMCGAYLAEWMVAQVHNDPHEEMNVRGPLFQTIAINLALGAITPGVDNACHVGGLVGGFIVGGAFALIPLRFSPVKRAVVVALVCLATLGAIRAKLHAAPSPELALVTAVRTAEKAEQELKARSEREKAELAKEVAYDRNHGARTVSPQIAAGKAIALAATPSSVQWTLDGARIVVTKEDAALQFIDAATHAPGPAIKGPGASAVALAPDGRTAYVTSTANNSVGIVDLQSNTLLGSIKTGKGPRAIVVNQSGERAYVLNDADNTVIALDLKARTSVGKPVSIGTNQATQYHPVGLWLVAGDKELWVLDESASRLLVLDAASLAEIKEIILTSGYMNGAHFDLARGKAWAVGVDAVDQIDLATKKIEHTAYLCEPARPAAVAINRDGTLLALAEPGGFVKVAKLRTGATVASYPYEGTPIGLQFSPDGKQLVLGASPQARLTVLDTSVSLPREGSDNPAGANLLCSGLR